MYNEYLDSYNRVNVRYSLRERNFEHYNRV